jgi:hypothetical protein
MQRLWITAMTAAALAYLEACSSVPSALPREKVPAAITSAEQALQKSDAETALEWMRAAAVTKDLPTEQRDRIQLLLERAAELRIQQLSKPGSDPSELEDLVDLGLPRQLAVSAGVRAAQLWVAEDEPMEAFQLLKKLDTRFPLHHERQVAGDLLCDVGLQLIPDAPGFLGLFSTRDEGEEILEYVILNAPWAKRSDEAFAALSKSYEEAREWALAIERSERLVLSHPASPLRISAQARIPHLRLSSLKSPEYDRIALQKARTELEEWLIAYSGHTLEPAVRIDLGDCLRRLSDNDLIVSHFYDRVDNAYGARRHARRAIQEARDAGDQKRVAEASEWLAGLPAVKDPLTGADFEPFEEAKP